MAARTLTATSYNLGPKGAHIGLNVVPFDFNSGAGKLGTVSDVVMLAKIPNYAVVTDVDLLFGVEANAATTWTVQLLALDPGGTTSVYATLNSVASITANATTKQVYKLCSPTGLSMSDDKVIQYAALVLNCTVGASETVSYSFQGSVKFLTDGVKF